jgi:transposase
MYTPIEWANDLTPADVLEFQKENLRLKQEVEIFKKAMTIFATGVW